MSNPRITIAFSACLTLSSIARAQDRQPIASPAPDVRDDARIWGKSDAIGGPRSERSSLVPPPIKPDKWLVLPKADQADDWQAVAPYVLDPGLVPSVVSAPQASASKESAWQALSAENRFRIACAYTSIHCDEDQVRIARLDGARYLFVNGDGFVGDVERRGFGGVPVALRKGDNALFVFGVPETFSLELWSPTSRMLIATWDAGFDGTVGNEESITYPVLNASLASSNHLHLHYGHATAMNGKCQPRLTDWADGKCAYLPPLGMWSGATYYFAMGTDDCPDPSPKEGALIPLCVWANGDSDAARELISWPNGVESARKPTPQRNRDSISEGLAARLGRTPHLIYGTHAGEAEARSLLARARFDQQLVWYRTGLIPLVLSDDEYLNGIGKLGAPPKNSNVPLTLVQGNLVLYGNSLTNSAWYSTLASERWIAVRRGVVELSDRKLEGEDITGWFIARHGDPMHTGFVAVVASTGLRGSQLGYLLRPLTEGAREGEFAFYRRASNEAGALTLLSSGVMEK